jgi:hypothetical protein
MPGSVFTNPKKIGLYVSRCQKYQWNNSNRNTIIQILGNHCHALVDERTINTNQKVRPLWQPVKSPYMKRKRGSLPNIYTPAPPTPIILPSLSTLSKERQSMVRKLTQS